MFGRTATSVDSSVRTTQRNIFGKQSASVAAGQLIPHIRSLAESLQTSTSDQLRAEVTQVRRELARGTLLAEPHLLVAGLALACEALRRTISVTLYDVQVPAALSMAGRCVVQMQTGEGKTFVALAAALHLSLAGRGVHVITPTLIWRNEIRGWPVRWPTHSM